MDYDVLILGGGIIGCAVAYELSKYSLNVALIEKDYDIADDVSLTNTAIVYDGMESKDDLMAKLEFMGNLKFDEISNKFSIPFQRKGSLMIAEGKNGEIKIEQMYQKAIERGMDYVRLLKGYEIREIEPNISEDVKMALYSPNTGVICPYDLAIAYAEVAFDNGVIFKLEEEVIDIEKISRGVRVTTNKNKFTCRMVVNTTPVDNYSIYTQKSSRFHQYKYLNYFLLNKENTEFYSNNIFCMMENGDELIYTKSPLGNGVGYVKTDEPIDVKESVKRSKYILKENEEKKVDSFYISNYYKDNIIIDDSFIRNGYINITGKSYAEITMTPYIAAMVVETITNNIPCKAKKDFNDRRRPLYRFKELSDEEMNEVIKMDSMYGKMICVCSKVTEGEIVDSIRRPLGARTVEGVKRRTGAIVGRCRGAYCINKIIEILARETGKPMMDIVMDSKKSKIVLNRIKEFDSM
ncbi:FAD-dependent oxidoreductase [Clostridium sp. 19966]|uniref:NAD(P)/FAD-dependent oxidoreductase n=1 Tax=Clostridium sp. 19966 TaxID=2768166 RepID=UPI0028DDC559|nr:FAD-dependent oxidoreductase [Clostridium sp. 19966]MDT8718878.1 FAD-dependent oxidoreductase [Clostridium sp. 19966]